MDVTHDYHPHHKHIFPLSFPFPSPFDLSFALKKKRNLRIYPIDYSFSPCVMHNGERDGSPELSGFSLWALDDAHIVKWRQSG